MTEMRGVRHDLDNWLYDPSHDLYYSDDLYYYDVVWRAAMRMNEEGYPGTGIFMVNLRDPVVVVPPRRLSKDPYRPQESDAYAVVCQHSNLWRGDFKLACATLRDLRRDNPEVKIHEALLLRSDARGPNVKEKRGAEPYEDHGFRVETGLRVESWTEEEIMLCVQNWIRRKEGTDDEEDREGHARAGGPVPRAKPL